MASKPQVAAAPVWGRLKLLSFNIQVGLTTSSYRHYVTRSWRHVLPSAGQLQNLDRIARLVADYDLVGLQETDAGSLRSANLNQVRYLAERGDFPYWHAQVNRDLGQLGQHSLGLLSRLPPLRISEHKLPGLIPGRGVLMARFGTEDHPLLLVVTHLSLSRRARAQQLHHIGELIQGERHVVIMGDTNCEPEALMQGSALRDAGLRLASRAHETYPSWRPRRNIDHILVSESIEIRSAEVIDEPISDHLPIAVEIDIQKTAD